MPATRSPTQQAASRANGAGSRGPTTDAGKARSAKNGTRHGPRGGAFALLPGEDRGALAELNDAVTSDWSPRDAYERSDSGAVHWLMELVTCMWRQDRRRGLELATLTASAAESPPAEATMRKLPTFARYGARIDKDIRALQALRVLRDRPDAWLDELKECTFEPEALPITQICTNELSLRTGKPEARQLGNGNCTSEFAAGTPEPERPLNRHQRRALAAMQRRRAA